MRAYDRVPCLAIINYQSGNAVIGLPCQKDCRHGHGAKRLSFHYHRWDGHLPTGEKIKVIWDGIAIMTEEMARKRAEGKNRPPYKQGKDDWIRGVED